jgi:hypothetical protein
MGVDREGGGAWRGRRGTEREGVEGGGARRGRRPGGRRAAVRREEGGG